MFRNGGIRTADGRIPKTIAFLHCVGSRDEKVNQRHCSRVCCITGVKQAIEMKQAIPDAEVYKAFTWTCECSAPATRNSTGRRSRSSISISSAAASPRRAKRSTTECRSKAEDTLIGLPLKMTVDMLVLIVGMKAGACNLQWSRCNGVDLYPSGFVKPKDQFTEASTRVAAYLLCRNDHGAEKHRGSRSTKPSPPHTGWRIAKE